MPMQAPETARAAVDKFISKWTAREADDDDDGPVKFVQEYFEKCVSDLYFVIADSLMHA